MERGEKNRYSNIWPFEWNRVKIPHTVKGQDYFNGSYIQDGQGIDGILLLRLLFQELLRIFGKLFGGRECK